MLRSRLIIQLVAAALLVALVAVPASAHAARLAPATKQRLHVNVGSLPRSLDPGQAGYVHELAVANALFAPLYRSSRSGTLVPFLAAGQPKVTNRGRRVTIRLRAARWSDGRPITAGDVALAARRARKTSFWWSFFGSAQVRAVGTRTVRIDFQRALPWRTQLLAMPVLTPVPSHVIRRVGERWTQPKHLVSSGPFRYEDVRGRSELTLARNDRWWGARSVRLRTLVLRAVPTASATSLFRAGRLDASLPHTSVHQTALSTWRKDPRYRTVAGSDAQYLYLNTRADGPLARPEVRRGIALAVDRAAIADTFGRPLARMLPSAVRGANVIGSGTALLSADGAPDLDRARQELAIGGVPSAPLQLWYSSDSSQARRTAELVQRQLSRVSVRVELHSTPGDRLARVGYGVSPVRTDVDMVLQGWTVDHHDPQNVHQLWACSSIDAGRNASNYCDPAYDALLADASRDRPFPERATAHREVEQHLTGPGGSMPAVPLYEPRADYLVQPWVRGYVMPPHGVPNFEQVALLAR